MKRVLALVMLILILMSSLVSCYIPIRKAKIEDVYCELERDMSPDGESYTYTLNLQAQEKILDLVVQVNLYTEDGEFINSCTLRIGQVVPGDQYTYQLDVSNMTTAEHEAATQWKAMVVSGSVVIP